MPASLESLRARLPPEDVTVTGSIYDRYMYASAFDTNGLMRSAAKMFILCHAKSMASVFTMCIGIQEFASVLLLEPFSSPTMKKSHSRTFKPTNDLLHKEIARRSHFIIKEWESESTDNHPLLSAAGRVRAPEPKGWNTDRSTKWLAANGLKPSRQDMRGGCLAGRAFVQASLLSSPIVNRIVVKENYILSTNKSILSSLRS